MTIPPFGMHKSSIQGEAKVVAYSEIRRVGSRDRSFPPRREVPQPTFSADMFLPKANRDRISYRRGPGLGENTLIVDCELKLQVLAPIFGIEF